MGAAWEHRAGCRAHTGLAVAKLTAKASKEKAEIQKENPKEKLRGASAPPKQQRWEQGRCLGLC